MRELFSTLVDAAFAALLGDEVLLANFSGEVTDFVRFNRARVRQAMTVRQAELRLTLIRGRRRNEISLMLSGSPSHDTPAVLAALHSLRAELAELPEDPYLLYSTDAVYSERIDRGSLPEAGAAIDDVTATARGTDFVGLLASGPVIRGCATSLGARHWHQVESFLLDWSLYHAGDKAVKCSWSGSAWDRAELAQRIDTARDQLDHLRRPACTIAPGEYRAYLAPAALDALLRMLSWGGLSEKALRTKQSCLQKLVDGETTLSTLLQIAEDTAGSLAPSFDEMAFTKPARVDLVRDGRHAGSMISPRTGAEYGIAANGADDDETMSALAVTPGALAEADILAALDTGLLIGNLHYLNFSDRANGRVTGMTRFATFWVERGAIVGPVNAMRWDDTLYRMLGSQLEALSDAPQWFLNNGTYGRRSVQTSRIPGALLQRMAFTL